MNRSRVNFLNDRGVLVGSKANSDKYATQPLACLDRLDGDGMGAACACGVAGLGGAVGRCGCLDRDLQHSKRPPSGHVWQRV
jgi:hypothetical protein